MAKVWLNDRLVQERAAKVSVYDHGFLYGDGIYETVHAYAGEIFEWPKHDQRLRASARKLELAVPWSSSYLQRALIAVAKANKAPEGSLRITISRGPGPLGLDPALCPRPTLAIMLHPGRHFGEAWKNGITVGIVRTRRMPPESLDPQIKSNNALNTILAKMEAKRMKVTEALLLNGAGYLTEGTTTNLFFIKGKTLHTPSVKCGLLAGVTRSVVLDLASAAQLRPREGFYTPDNLRGADEAFLSSTTLEVVPIIRLIHGRRKILFSGGIPGRGTQRLQALFQAYVNKTLKNARHFENIH